MVRRGAFEQPGPWMLDWIEVLSSDITEAFGAAGEPAPAAQLASSQKGRTTRSQPALERAKRALAELYPQEVSDQSVVPNKQLCRLVNEQLAKNGRPAVSPDTILRAAGRRN